MHIFRQDIPIVLVKPDDRIHPVLSMGEPDSDLEEFAKSFFPKIGISSFHLVTDSSAPQTVFFYWSGSKDGVEYEVSRGRKEYPFGVWIGLTGKSGWDDRLVEVAHSVADTLSRAGWQSLVSGFLSAQVLP